MREGARQMLTGNATELDLYRGDGEYEHHKVGVVGCSEIVILSATAGLVTFYVVKGDPPETARYLWSGDYFIEWERML